MIWIIVRTYFIHSVSFMNTGGIHWNNGEWFPRQVYTITKYLLEDFLDFPRFSKIGEWFKGAGGHL